MKTLRVTVRGQDTVDLTLALEAVVERIGEGKKSGEKRSGGIIDYKFNLRETRKRARAGKKRKSSFGRGAGKREA